MSRQLPKDIQYGDKARSAVLGGVNKLADAVVVTLGPRGRNVLFERPNGDPVITKDGVTVAREVHLEDLYEDLGARMLRSVAHRTCELAGDGTTTATALARTMFVEGMKHVATGVQPTAIRRGMEVAAQAAEQLLKDQSKPADDQRQLKQIAEISSNGDEELSKFIVDAYDRIGRDGVILVENGRGGESSLEVSEGLQIESGWLDKAFVNDERRMVAELTDARVVLVERRVQTVNELQGITARLAQHPVLLVAYDFDPLVVNALAVAMAEKKAFIVPVKCPGYGEWRQEAIEDLAVITQAKPAGERHGLRIEALRDEHAGRAESIVVSRNATIVAGGAGTVEEVDHHAQRIEALIGTAANQYEQDRLARRKAKITGGVALIRLVAWNEVELRERKDRLEDALHATRAAIAEGVLPGGGVALLRASAMLDSALRKTHMTRDEQVGVQIVRHALREPLRIIARNAGYEPETVIERVLRSKKPTFGFNAENGKYGDLYEMGIIDPLLVARSALGNAASAAGLLLTTECTIVRPRTPKELSGEEQLSFD